MVEKPYIENYGDFDDRALMKTFLVKLAPCV